MVATFERAKIEKSEALGRLLRKDEPDQLGTSTWELLKAAIRAGDEANALRLLDYLHEGETAPRHFFFFDWMYGNQSFVVEGFGPGAYEQMFRTETERAQQRSPAGTVGGFPAQVRSDAEAMVKRQAEIMRGHWPPRGGIVIVEEPDRYVISLFPCNSGGRMLRAGMTEGKWNLAVNQEPYPWAWKATGKPFCCFHCVLGRGIMATEAGVAPLRLHDDPGRGFNPDRDHPFDPCRMIFYKDPR